MDKLVKSREFELTNSLRGRSLHTKVIPTVCNLKNMLNKLVEVNGDYTKLKQWEQSCYKHYRADEIQSKIMQASQIEWKHIIRDHILWTRPSEFGANPIDIYLVGYVAQKIGVGKKIFIRYIIDEGISEKENSAQAIWQVGKGDGVYLDILYPDGSIRDWEFMNKWLTEIRIAFNQERE